MGLDLVRESAEVAPGAGAACEVPALVSAAFAAFACVAFAAFACFAFAAFARVALAFAPFAVLLGADEGRG
eukprot:CAMPEP_0171946852 /NCGR_PEP_ID=MMETSP0993-20121228/57310_1 /TAXON_ID=483369 /ORGANISM="non described non described, Strain CCMP2098" /LENGTH=70 /DNA_ID=CAMNT_0012590395 /DNA_START=228 /DNA_END=437 /DNA_ORIENTATION=-